MQGRVLSNAIWNVIAGMSGAIVSVLVPPFLTRQLSHDAYGAWALALQIGTYINLFGFGLQIAVGRYVAYAEARGDYIERDGIVATAFWFLTGAATVGFAVICVLAFSIEHILPDLSPDLVGQTRSAVILLGLSFAISLPGTVFAAVFTGLQRSHIPAIIQTGGRAVLALALIVSAPSHNLAILAATYAMVSFLIVLTLWSAWLRRTIAPTVGRRNASRIYGRELFGFCLSLSVWNLSMLMMSGLDLIIVGHWDFAFTPYYAVGVTLSTFVASVLSSLCNALVPAAAASIAAGGTTAALAMLRRSFRLISAISILAGAPLIFAGYALLSLWVGAEYAIAATPILAILAFAGVIRNILLPYVTIAIGTGEQRRMFWTPIVEGVSSLVLSLALVQYHGAQGVACAKIIGATIGLSLLIGQNALARIMPTLSRLELMRESLLRPAFAWILLGVAYLALMTIGLAPLLLMTAMAVLTLALVVTIVLAPEDRAFVLRFGRHLTSRHGVQG